MRRFAYAALPAALALAACGGGQEITTTDSNNVVLNDAHANVAFTNDDEVPANEMIVVNSTPTEGGEANSAMPAGNAM